MTLVYIIFLLLIGSLLLGIEMFVPGGVIGLIGVGMMGGAVWLSFDHYGTSEGLAILMLSITIIVMMVIFALKRLPHSTIGKWIILESENSKEKGFHSDTFAKMNLIDKVGISESKLRPSGIALFDGERLDVVTEGEFIDPQTRIRVVRVDGNRVVVERE